MFLLISALLVVSLFVWYKAVQYQQGVKLIPIPGPPTLPFIGNLLEIVGSPSLWITSLPWFFKYGNIVQIKVFGTRIVLLAGHDEAVKDLYTNKAFIKGVLVKDFEDVTGKTGMIFSDGESWSRVRKTCVGTFNTSHLQLFVEPMKSCIEILVKRLSEKSSTPQNIQPVEVDEIFMLTTLDIIGRTMFSVDLQSLEHGESELSKAVETYLIEAFKPLLNPIHYVNPVCIMKRKKACKFLVSYMETVVKQRIQERSASSSKPSTKDLLDLLLDAQDPETGIGLTKEELKDQVITFMIAGHETTAHSLTFTVGNIAQHPHVEKLIYEELDEVVGKANGTITYETVANLPYLTAVIKESMRVFPVVGAMFRQLQEDATVGGYDLPKGTLVAANILAMHFNPLIWKDPTTFDPSRFLKSESNHISSTSYAPFGHGKRSCIGQHFAMLELKLILATMLYNFKFRLFPMQIIDPVQSLTFRPKGGLRMIIEKRTTK